MNMDSTEERFGNKQFPILCCTVEHRIYEVSESDDICVRICELSFLCLAGKATTSHEGGNEIMQAIFTLRVALGNSVDYEQFLK